MMLLSVQFFLQILFDFRGQGADVAALVNILFYSPAAYLLFHTNLKMASTKEKERLYAIICGTNFALIVLCYIIGAITYKSLHMPHALYAMGTLFFVNMVFLIVYPANEIRRVRRLVEDETADDIQYYNIYMRTGSILLYGIALLVPLFIYFTKSLFVFGPLILFALIFYVVNFIALGFNLTSVSAIIDETTDEECENVVNPESADGTAESEVRLSADKVCEIENAIAKWRKERGYSDTNLNSSTMARRLGIPKKMLTQYISEKQGLTFRVWLSNIRIEEVKRLLLEDTFFSNEAVAQECGFSSRTWLQQKFKASTGLTPNEWRESQRKG